LAFVEEDCLGNLNVSLDNVSVFATPPAPTSWQVYFGTDPTPDATELRGTTTNRSWTLGTLQTCTTYYWQICSVRAGQTNAGPVWQFTTSETTNQPPTISLNPPDAFAVYRLPTNILLSPHTFSTRSFITRIDYFCDGASLGHTLASPWSLTWTNPTPGEHALQAVALDSAGLRATSSVAHVTVLPANGALMALVPFGSTWRYNDRSRNLGSVWRTTSYDDGKWSLGLAQLGYGEGDEAMLVDYGVDPRAKNITTYFRKNFTPPNGVQSLWLRVLRDDGVAVYLNGDEVLRDNLPTDADYATLATVNITGAGKTVLVTGGASVMNLSRANVVAAEIHLADPASVAMSFDLELSGVVNVRPTVSLTAPTANTVFFEPASVLLAASAFAPYSAVTRVEFLAGDTSLGSVSNVPYALTWRSPLPGNYLLSAKVTDDEGITIRSASVPISIAGLPPVLTIVPGVGRVLLRCPLSCSGYRVETATNLIAPILWLPYADTFSATNGASLELGIPISAQPRFFRLTAP
ncbi:MAG: Ig-like domain-containing protein, partial [Verrucomicrobia bacterium]|nr:Ig-like domain-containing protein [Verrucomicrobiota bacterium]